MVARCTYSKPARWHAFPIADESESAGLIEGKNVRFFCGQHAQIIESCQLSNQVDLFLSEDLL